MIFRYTVQARSQGYSSTQLSNLIFSWESKIFDKITKPCSVNLTFTQNYRPPWPFCVITGAGHELTQDLPSDYFRQVYSMRCLFSKRNSRWTGLLKPLRRSVTQNTKNLTELLRRAIGTWLHYSDVLTTILTPIRERENLDQTTQTDKRIYSETGEFTDKSKQTRVLRLRFLVSLHGKFTLAHVLKENLEQESGQHCKKNEESCAI